MPYAGYGMNAGIADAMNLSWHLAAHLAGWADERILDAYEIERLPITEQVSRFAMDHAQQMIKARGAVPARIEDAGAEGEAIRAEHGREAYELNVQQFCCAGLNFGYFYDRSPLIAYDGEAAPAYTMGGFTPSTVPGCRTPHFLLADGRSLYDAFGAGLHAAALRSRASTSRRCSPRPRRARVPLALLDVERGATPPTIVTALVLCRADQHVAWRGDAVPADRRARWSSACAARFAEPGAPMNTADLIAIDTHTHLEVSCRNPFDNYGEEYDRAADKYFRSCKRPTMDETIAYYREKKIGFVNFTVDAETQMGRRRIPNEEIAEAAQQNSDIMIAFGSIDPHKGKMGGREARKLVEEYGVKGFKFHPTVQGFEPADKMAWPIYEVIAEHKLPAVFHSGHSGIGSGMRCGCKRHRAGWKALRGFDHREIHPGKGTPVSQIEMRRISDGVKISERYKTTDQVEKATIEDHNFNYLYEDADGFHFMNADTYDQVQVPKDVVGSAAPYCRKK